ncbi:hypothetical protein CBF34_08530 [Vagococcus penaei]|uniref:class C sortase n=1 Tax=Vagococcus penaei TaxID=633807 RepID=UPI000F89C61E|nr:class C sortase [Vagococcus penaei]RSU00424.1 hypothetical protein CBF34_08530 [Vagococcus penaei]
MRQIIGRLIFLIGTLVICYPLYAGIFNHVTDDIRLRQFAKKSQIEQKTRLDTLRKTNEEMERKGLNVQYDPFKEDATFDEVVLNEHLIGELTIPKLSATMPVFDTITNQILENGAGVIPGTSQPTGGRNSHSVISAHRGLAERELFRDLNQLKKGDVFILTILGETLAYQVIHLDTVLPEDTEVLKMEENRDLVTLLTCTPYMVNTHRLLVTGERIPWDTTLTKTKDAAKQKSYLKQILLFVGVLIGIVILIASLWRQIWLYRMSRRKFTLVFYDVPKKKVLGKENYFQVFVSKLDQTPLVRGDDVIRLQPNSSGKVVLKDIPGGYYYLQSGKNRASRVKFGMTRQSGKFMVLLPSRKQKDFIKVVKGRCKWLKK